MYSRTHNYTKWNAFLDIRTIFDHIAEQFQIHCQDDWYSKQKEIEKELGSNLLNMYDDSFAMAMRKSYPDMNMKYWLFEKVPPNYWDNIEHHLEFMEWICLEFNIQSEDELYKIKRNDIISHGGGSMIDGYYDRSHSLALSTIYPHIDWKYWKFDKIPSGYWDFDEVKRSREYIDWIAEQLHIDNSNEWYKISIQDIIGFNGGEGFLRRFDSSPSEMLKKLYPDVEWQCWKFESVPKGYWDNIENRKIFFDWIAEELNINNEEDWYVIDPSLLFQRGGYGLLKTYYDGSFNLAVMDLFPHFHWKPWKFRRLSRNHWDNKLNQLNFIQWFEEIKDIKTQEDWYNITKLDIVQSGGSCLLDDYHHGNLVRALSFVYPDVEWQPWRFESTPFNSSYFRRENRMKFMEYIGDTFLLNHARDWIGMTKRRLEEFNYGRSLLWRYGGSLLELLKDQYPHQHWNSDHWILRSTSRSHELLGKIVGNLLPNGVEVEMEKSFRCFGLNITVDLWIPYHNIALEYQGSQHYMESSFIQKEDDIIFQYRRDHRKISSCQHHHISVLSIPYWWNIHAESVERLLGRVSISIFLSFSIPIISLQYRILPSRSEYSPYWKVESLLYPLE